jgi:xanthine dehydrogenase YagR molybdenum-binding subunit
VSAIDGGRILNATTARSQIMGGIAMGIGMPLITPLRTKGVGELAITGMAAAIANAVYHATGTRIRSLPPALWRKVRRPRWIPLCGFSQGHQPPTFDDQIRGAGP